jgi:hypothetical protein
MVKETAEETSNSPIAIRSGFCSGLARAMILRKDEMLGDFEGGGQEKRERFGGGGVDWVELCLTRRLFDDTNTGLQKSLCVGGFAIALKRR